MAKTHHQANFKDLTGKLFGKWKVDSRAPDKTTKRGDKETMWKCQCECGTQKEVSGHTLNRGSSKSCGCVVNGNKFGLTHGKSQHKIYRVWADMIHRCTSTKSTCYHRYGGRGITVEKSWMQFENFYKDMGDAPSGMTIERIDNEKGYSKENCKWASRHQQNRNKRDNVSLTVDGRTMVLADWSKESGISQSVITSRLKSGWSGKDAVTIPANQKFNHFIQSTNR